MEAGALEGEALLDTGALGAGALKLELWEVEKPGNPQLELILLVM